MRAHSKIIGLTGGIATGKSTVSKFLKKWRFPIICADTLAHDVVKPNKAAYKKIVKTFGKHILLQNKTLDRSKIAKIVFDDVKLRKKLEKIIHPEVRKEMHRLIQFYKKKKNPLIFLDVPLLFESGLNKICDHTLCVAATQNLQVARLKKYLGMTHKQALARIQAQMPLTIKIKKANFVIWNTGTKKELEKKTKKWLQTCIPII